MYVSLYTAASLDMKIADTSHTVEYLDWVKTPEGEDYGYHEFYQNIDGLIMGRKTYDISFELGGGQWPYTGNKPCFVFTRSDTIQHVDENNVSIVNSLDEFIKMGLNDRFWLLGGGELVRAFLNRDLIDRMIIHLFPVVLGDGIPLFPDGTVSKKFMLSEEKKFENGILELRYEREI